MLSAAIRVIARSAAIQLEEVTALSATATATTSSASAATSRSAVSSARVGDKGKSRAIDLDLDVDAVAHGERQQYGTSSLGGSTATAAGIFPQTQSLSDRLEKHGALGDTRPSISKPSSSSSAKALSPLDRLIQQAPHTLPPPAPDTHPDRKYEAERLAREKAKQIEKEQDKERKKKVVKPLTSTKSSLDELIRNAPHTPPPPSPDTHPDRKLEAEWKLRQGQSQGQGGSSSGSSRPAEVKAKSAGDKAEKQSKPPLGSSSDSSGLASPQQALSVQPIIDTAPSSSSQATSLKEEPVTVQATTVSKTSSSDFAVPDLEPVNSKPVIDTVDGIEDLKADPTTISTQLEEEDTPVVLRASKVPSSRIGRLFHYGSLAASLSFGAASESIRRTTGGNKSGGSVFMSDANIRRLVATLGRMRGAALKLGQFMSIQDNHMLPPEIERVLHQVQAHANYMPDWQMEKVMREEFGSNWQSLFSSFDRTPIASASIGQVHRAVLASDSTPVAVKIQFPGVASSIESDLSNLSLLLRSSALLPKGLYLQNTIAVMRRELQDECDYIKEAAAGRKFSEYLAKDGYFQVPKVVDEATTDKVLTTQWMDGKPLSRVKNLSQEARDRIGTNILRLCLMELFQFRFMQTDPNWANFLYSSSSSTSGTEAIQLIDFGASREYTKEFMDGWYRLLKSCLEGDRVRMKEESLSLGYLTGEENDVMLEAHLDSMALVASPFSYQGKYPFAKQTITDSVRALIPIMLKHRLTPPPQETYSLNRKLSGAFLMCAKLGANVDCQKLWEDVVGDYREG
ncbi:Atypical/ABC1/ABC1-A protein kinase [Kwoniella heveanensis CBS 569]|uniref:Atypical/ABC1/ABC1-A protein kinase n=1 Tax=Kwoniella heveanensis BCC8398 TaxID=1296120 RepID=A0A1B9H182_9TREE|nr:Atypical/ABC1/ABC1-A protein kinase [Kwoniella heveanensis BCC8398]OCF43495.1 Atypical/ABC1/ABC1-A protein kinase [Kwoniella heveanensis CBS 569]